ncbi:cell wall hydrolase [Sphingomonas sp.]|uniref:cell wall hydrolase n=1 Tax=Sphingomonas sp. TaxID=28214 RepID=UPI00286A4E89|nr:cell wall hydrolase [Sphingomonas sp.]
MGLLMLVMASGQAPAQSIGAQSVTQSGPSFDLSTITASAVKATPAFAQPRSIQPRSLMSAAMAPVRQFVAAVTGQSQATTLAVSSAIAREAAWLFHGGWPLRALVDRYSAGAPLDAEATCLATAVYFEARGESAEGQLAVARVVMNRAASGKYPPTWCSTVKQPAQFSFVRNGQFPSVKTGGDAWRKAQAITRLAMSNAVPSLSSDVLWYHANYVAPSWGRRLTRAEKIGAHIFYRT